ncbi:MAG: hypothetical protein KDB61_16920, partial [Planctomycetes bacterium]|nr:hypothetical protein [Planctomycetota bacterium]
MTTDFKVNETDRFRVTAWGNMSLTASTGDGAFADTDFLDVDENRWVFDLQHPLKQDGFENFHGGLIQYNRAGLATREIFAGTSWNMDELIAEVTAYWDVDEADGIYANGSVQGHFEVDEQTTGYWRASLGFATSNMADFLYLDDSAGFSDLALEAGANRPLNRNTNLHAMA